MSISFVCRTAAAVGCALVLTACENMPTQVAQVLNDAMATTATGNNAPAAGYSLINTALPLGRYRSYNYNDLITQFTFSANGKISFSDLSKSPAIKGTWKQEGARITVVLNLSKGRKGVTVYEYRSEARSKSVAEGCRKQAPGLYPISQDGQPVRSEFVEDLIVWSERYTQSKNGPCLSPK